MTHQRPAVLWLLLLTAGAVRAQAPLLPPGEREPFLRLETGGPTAVVTGLAFSPDGQMLYAAGWDKVVRVWVREPRTGRYLLAPHAYRVPIGPGLDGAINALALSSDGTWLAVGGRGVVRGESGFRDVGLVIPTAIGSLTPERRLDRGLIYVFNTRTQAVRLLRGHRGQVLSLAFAPSRPGQPPLLVSVGQDWDDQTGKYVGAVRLWDLTRDEPQQAFQDHLPDPGNTRPGLVVTANGEADVSAGLAWGDGRFRLWLPRRDAAAVQAQEDGRFNSVAAAQGSLVLTGSMVGYSGRLQVWSLNPFRADPQGQVVFPPQGSVAYFPRALTLLSSKPNGPTDLAAVVLRAGSQPPSYRLDLIDLRPTSFGQVRARLDLWKGSLKQPVMAAAPGGTMLAVTGNDEFEIFLYPIADLLAGKAEPQRLRGVGATFRYVAFARTADGKQQGLLLSESAAPRMGPIQPGDVLFDLTSSDLASNLKGWQPAFPDARGWTVASASVGGKTLLTIRQNNQVVRTIELAATQLVTSLALLPPQRHIDFPLLALALLDQGRPRLLLYNGQSGEPIRQLNGHADAIRALAFSADGRFLASASEDQTVSVWGLLNRDRILGQRGLLPGVAVKEDNGRVVVTRVFDDSPAHGKLQPGEVIQGVVEGNEVRPLASLLAYYEAVALHKPGSTITLRVEADRKTRDMALVVSQGVDERKPLYSLFLTRSGRGGERHWIGWSPIGPYDSSGPQAERYLAWHFNTGQPGEPTRCALADQYRKEYHREGLLTLLNETGNLSDALAAWEADRRRQPLPPPTLTVWLAELGPGAPVDGQGHLLVRQPRQALQLAIDDFPAEGVASVEYRLDQGPRQPLPRVGGEYRADLPELKPGVHRAQVIVRTNEVEPKEYAAELTVRYQPPPPVIVAQVPPWQVVNDATFTFKAEVQPARPGLEVQVRLSQRHQGKELLTADQQLTGLRIDRTLRLPPGDSVIEVVAVNKDALASHEEWETRRLSIVVHRPEPVPAPRVVLERVVPARGAAPAVEPGRPVVVAERRVRIVGRLEATQELTQAGWARGERGPVQPLTRFEPGKHKTWAIDEQLTLEPGRQIVRVVARTALSPEAEGRLVVEYRPPLPEAIVLGPANGLTLYEGRDPGVVELVARLVRAADPQPFSAVVVLNDKPLAQVPSIDEEAGVLRAKVPLQPGDNRLQLQLENEWHGLATTAAVTVRYLRPPRRLAWERPQPGDKPLVDLTARAESPLPLAPERVRLEVNGQPVKAAAEVTPSGKDPTLWTIQVRRVPLAAGDNRLSLWVGNGDGWSLEPATLTVAYQPPKPPAPPEVTLLEPASDQAVTEARQRVRFRVRSASPLREVVLVRHADGSPPQVRPIDVAALKPLAGGRFELLSHTELDLRPGINRLHVEARNDDGPTSTAPVTITYAPLPVRLVIDRITVPGGITLQPTAQADGLLAFPPAPSGRVLVHGRVLWDRPDDEKLKGVHMVRVYVNGFQQVPVSLLSTSANRERAFQAEILLNRLTSNLVEVELPELAQDTGNRRRCTLDCLKPVTGQRLHLLIVAIGEADEEKLTDQVLRAMQAGRDAKGRLRTPVFDEVVLYGPLVGYVTRGQVGLQIHKMKQALDRRAAAGSANDVILLYFQGGEAAQARHVFLRTSASQFDPDLQRSGIRGTDLINRLGDALGAQVLLLDVLRAGPTDTPSPEQPARWQDPGRVALFRYAYLGISPRSGSVPGLLDDFAEGMRHAERLGDVAAHISQHFRLVSEGLAWVSKRSPKLVADLYVPGSLMDMPISGKRTSP